MQHPYVYGLLVFEAMAIFIRKVSVLSLIAIFGVATIAMVLSCSRGLRCSTYSKRVDLTCFHCRYWNLYRSQTYCQGLQVLIWLSDYCKGRYYQSQPHCQGWEAWQDLDTLEIQWQSMIICLSYISTIKCFIEHLVWIMFVVRD